MTTAAWVIGSSGLLGRAMTRMLESTGRGVVSRPMPWTDQNAFTRATAATFSELTAADSWEIYWCAGAGIVGTSEDELDKELAQFTRFLRAIESASAKTPLRGSLFYASSAGGVYAKSTHPPFTEKTIPVPNSAYGRAKLAAEAAAIDFSRRSGTALIIGRIANLYGADQRLDKAQGLISQLCRGMLETRPTSLYVSLDTLRDYITADDCAGLIVDSMERLTQTVADGGERQVTKILASQKSVTIGAILGIFRSLFKRPANARIGSSPNAALQVRDLRLSSTVWPDLDHRTFTPLPVGIHAVTSAMLLARGASSH